ncbi:ATP-binding protein [Corallococcus macrosporus]|uniref:ATP-binding protein n=1 Tax=Corallococcus macrosporus TaxID=35 RepID=UPI0026C25261
MDPERLGLVLGNQVGNRVKHTPTGAEVRDTGEGIAPVQQARSFEKFYRAPGAPAGGAGLGLSIAKDIVQAHGGDIGVTSAPGQGCTFWFTLPRREEAGPVDS